MPPRPRPRPANRQASDKAQNVASSSTTQAASLARTDRESELDKGDEFFLRNRNRTAKDWKKLDKLTKKQVAQSSDENSDVEEVSDASSGTPRKRRKARQRDDNDLPEWTRHADIDLSLLATDDESDADVVNIAPKEVDDSTSRRNKRPRSRSKSLTPPPELSMQQILNVRNIIHKELGNVPRPDSPSNEYIDDSMDSIVLDEDLASIAREARARVNHGGDLEKRGGPENVTIKVHWQPHPLSPDNSIDVWTFETKRHNTFHALFEDIADTAGILLGSLALTHNGSRVFASATPHSLKIWAEAQMDASDLVTYEYLREQRQERPPPTANALAQGSSPPGSADDGESDSDSQSMADDDDGDIFKLVVRSGVTKDVTLKVRPMTTCGAIVKAFLKRAGIADQYLEGRSTGGRGGPRLMIDGERMDPETPISEADLEDGDQVEVDGLQHH